METLVAPVTLQSRVELWPAWIDAGVAKNDAMTGTDPVGVTVTIAVRVAEPAEFVAVSVYVFVEVGVMVLLAPATTPTF
jgi:hypothetical protein